jgi:hypothetical protein
MVAAGIFLLYMYSRNLIGVSLPPLEMVIGV